jgi:hypothetical protein
MHTRTSSTGMASQIHPRPTRHPSPRLAAFFHFTDRKKLVGVAAFSTSYLPYHRIASSFNFEESARTVPPPSFPKPRVRVFHSLFFICKFAGRAGPERQAADPPSLLRPLKDEGARHDCHSDAPGEIEVEASGAKATLITNPSVSYALRSQPFVFAGQGPLTSRGIDTYTYTQHATPPPTPPHLAFWTGPFFEPSNGMIDVSPWQGFHVALLAF